MRRNISSHRRIMLSKVRNRVPGTMFEMLNLMVMISKVMQHMLLLFLLRLLRYLLKLIDLRIRELH